MYAINSFARNMLITQTSQAYDQCVCMYVHLLYLNAAYLFGSSTLSFSSRLRGIRFKRIVICPDYLVVLCFVPISPPHLLHNNPQGYDLHRNLPHL